jgi:hypothetical protein
LPSKRLSEPILFLFHVRKILFLIALWHRNKNRINAKGNIFITPGDDLRIVALSEPVIRVEALMAVVF